MRRSVFLFCFILFYFFIHTFLVKFEITLFRYKAQNEAKRKKERKKERKKKKKKKKKKEKNSCTKKNARGPATDLLGQNMC